jgi:hypothetical protein
MLKITAKSFVWTILCLSLPAGCSDDAQTAEPLPQDRPREFSEEEKRAARALSISNTEVLAAAETPYAQALLCRHGITEVRRVMSETAGLRGEQKKALSQAEALFDRRLRDLVRSTGKSPGDIPADLGRTADENPDQSANVRTAMACLQKLQQG